MRTTIDAAGRVVIPKPIRDELGLMPGPIELVVTDSAVSIQAVSDDVLVEEDGLLVVRPTGTELRNDDVIALRRALQR